MKKIKFVRAGRAAACIAAACILASHVTVGRAQGGLEPDVVAPLVSHLNVPAFVPEEVVVQFRADAAEARQQIVRARVRATLRKRLRTPRMGAWGASRDLWTNLTNG
ncbi:MAG TPA: hypothetical protein VF600_10560 [Abditibacteriaceae bacterium]